MIKLKTHITDNKREFTSKSGNLVKLTKVYVFLPNLPYPEMLEMFGDLPPAGLYEGYYKLEVRSGRLQLEPDYSKFVASESK